MKSAPYIVIFGTLITAVVVAATTLSNKADAAKDLGFSLNHVELNPKKNIRGGLLGTIEVPIYLNISNMHKATLQVQAMDLVVSVDDRTLAYIKDTKGFLIEAVNTTVPKIIAKNSVIGFGMAIGGNIFEIIKNLKKGTPLADVLPKTVQVKGTIRAEGFLVPIDETTEVRSTDKK